MCTCFFSVVGLVFDDTWLGRAGEKHSDVLVYPFVSYGLIGMNCWDNTGII